MAKTPKDTPNWIAGLLPNDPEDDAKFISKTLKVDLPKKASPEAKHAFRLLVEQATQSIDYKSMEMSYDHPSTRMDYRTKDHVSFQHPSSISRNKQSKQTLIACAKACAKSPMMDLKTQVVKHFVREIGTAVAINDATFEGVSACLEAELLLPLRAINECQENMTRTSRMIKISPAKIKACVEAITKHCVKGDLHKWRYTNPLGARQLEGLNEKQLAKWMEPTRTQLPSGVVIHEDKEGDLGLFWATKIAGIGAFDVEGQCALALVANARNKVILVSDPKWPHYPCARAIFRMIWTPLGKQKSYDESSMQLGELGGKSQITHFTSYSPVLFVEPLFKDTTTMKSLDTSMYNLAVMAHAVAKADAMRVRLAVDPELYETVTEVVKSRRGDPIKQMSTSSEKIALRPSNGVVEFSEAITERHDWVQLDEELLGPVRRCIYAPPGMSTHPVIERAYGLEVEQSAREGLTKQTYEVGEAARAPVNFNALPEEEQKDVEEPAAKKQKIEDSNEAKNEEGSKAPEASKAEQEAPLPEGWTKRMSRSKGVEYYVHEARGISQFERPTA
eukprot:gnl/MRDRNA2_/MRDRNA2_120156_c0_seq1.p1 gnl/MRDRNA2_/MRDRNA2_120156_c0~~gnl/MRDRNA2_/MRDRNA2_120156_c0_seq1.p1  ORF type:complete len:561 (+),score=90.32 gnl/MRDRNA2_/MRDRNA2_120156_c0_seq1:56-1738(+)